MSQKKRPGALTPGQKESNMPNDISIAARYAQDRAAAVARAAYMMATLTPNAGSAIAAITEYMRDEFAAFKQQTINEIRPEDG